MDKIKINLNTANYIHGVSVFDIDEGSVLDIGELNNSVILFKEVATSQTNI
jgi:hypothetical protein